MRELANAFVRRVDRATVPQMMRSYMKIKRVLPKIKSNAGSENVFTARMFSELITTAAAIRNKEKLL